MNCEALERKSPVTDAVWATTGKLLCIVFTALHGMQTRSCDENSVCLSVCRSVKRVHCDKTEKNLSRFLYRAKDHLV